MFPIAYLVSLPNTALFSQTQKVCRSYLLEGAQVWRGWGAGVPLPAPVELGSRSDASARARLSPGFPWLIHRW